MDDDLFRNELYARQNIRKTDDVLNITQGAYGERRVMVMKRKPPRYNSAGVSQFIT